MKPEKLSALHGGEGKEGGGSSHTGIMDVMEISHLALKVARRVRFQEAAAICIVVIESGREGG